MDVLWAQNPTPISPATPIPLPAGNPQPNPSAEIVANTTLETYMQNTNTCLGCHVYAPIASTSSANANSHATHVQALLRRPELPAGVPQKRTTRTLLSSSNSYASDYSFLFGSAQMPSSEAALLSVCSKPHNLDQITRSKDVCTQSSRGSLANDSKRVQCRCSAAD